MPAKKCPFHAPPHPGPPRIRRSTASAPRQSSDMSSGTPFVYSLKEAMAFVPFHLERIIMAVSSHSSSTVTHTDLAEMWRCITLSTSFSGIGSPELASHYICMFFLYLLGRSCLGESYPVCLPVLWACEIDIGCQDELRNSKFAPMHLFDDILSFLKPQLASRLLSRIHEFSLGQLCDMIKEGNICKNSAGCIICSGKVSRRGRRSQTRRKECVANPAKVHAGGTPCIDFSPQWHAHQAEKGDAFITLFAFMAQRAEQREEICIHENVVGFNLQVLERGLSWLYIIFSEIFDVLSLGWAISRKRRFTVMIRRDLMPEVLMPYSVFISSCKRVRRWTFHEFNCDSRAEIISELQWARNREGSLFNVPLDGLILHITPDCQEWGANPEDVCKVALESPFTRALITTEVRRLMQYRERVVAKGEDLSNLACHISQEPSTHPQYSAEECLHTIISHSTMLWVQQWGRWMVPSEFLVSQGIAIDRSQLSHNEETPFCVSREGRSRANVICQAGNTMNLQAVSVPLMWAAFCVRLRRPDTLSESTQTLLALQR